MDVLTTTQSPLLVSRSQSEKWISNPLRRPSSLTILSRCSRQSRRQTAMLKEDNGMESYLSYYEIPNEICEKTHGKMGYRFIGDMFAHYKLTSENHNDENIPVVLTSYDHLMKFMTLFGIFTLQAPQQATAGLDLASSLQTSPHLSDLGDISTGFASAFLLIFFSELGDKTFFIAALLAARNSGLVVFLGTFGALATMTFISVGLGRTFHYVDEVLPFRLGETDLPIDDIAAVFLLVYFGVSTLIDASSGEVKAEEEQKEAELAVSELSGNGAGILAAANTIVSTFLLVFVAEWGDKSFFSTIALAAASSPLGIIAGALAGHAMATLIAVLGGSLLGTFLSEKFIAYIGGSLFLVFALVTLVEIVS
ncbi:unnamed protein product [Rhodiola kirilowii]